MNYNWNENSFQLFSKHINIYSQFEYFCLGIIRFSVYRTDLEDMQLTI